jgi:hypothetical protein
MSLQTWPDIGPPHVVSVVHSAHEPIVPSCELHVWAAGQPLPPEPRQPAWQTPALQTWPEVAAPQSPSPRHCTHLPIVAFVDVHSMPVGQPLPPVPRQPDPHVFTMSSQTLPLVAVPHAASF